MRTLRSIRADGAFLTLGARAWAVGALVLVCAISGLGAGVTRSDSTPSDGRTNDRSVTNDTAPTAAGVDVADASALRLQAVVRGRTDVANINGHIVRQGQTLDAGGATYTVRTIAAKSVVLTPGAGDDIVLHLGDRDRRNGRH